MARVILTKSGEDILVGGDDVDVIGTTSGTEIITVIDGTLTFDPSFNAGGDRISLPGTSEQYIVTIAGSRAILTRDLDEDGVIDDGDVTISIPLGRNENVLIFRDGDGTADDDRRTVAINEDGDLQIGDQIVEDGERLNPFAGEPTIRRVSVAEDGTQGNDFSVSPALSADGTTMAFLSFASNLVPGDTNGFADIFVVDLVTGDIERVSVSEDGVEGNGNSTQPSISADGTIVAFSSSADNLVSGDINAVGDLFVANLLTGEIVRISIAEDGTQAIYGSGEPSISADGTILAFTSATDDRESGDNDAVADVFVANLITGDVQRISVQIPESVENGISFEPSISADGTRVAFSSTSPLVPENSNPPQSIFVYDLATNEMRLVSIATDGTEPNDVSFDPSISADGDSVAFVSIATNLVPEDTNQDADIFVVDLSSGELRRISVSNDGTQANGDSQDPSISADGNLVAFISFASNLVAGDDNERADLFVYNLQTNQIRLISDAGDEPLVRDSFSEGPSLSADGTTVAFTGDSPNLVPGDTNSVTDIFVAQIENSNFNMV